MKRFVLFLGILLILFFLSIGTVVYVFFFTEIPGLLVKSLSNGQHFKVSNIKGTLASGLEFSDLEISNNGTDNFYLKVKYFAIKYDLLNSISHNQLTISKFYINDLYLKTAISIDDRPNSSNDQALQKSPLANNNMTHQILANLKNNNLSRNNHKAITIDRLLFTNVTLDNDEEATKPLVIKNLEMNKVILKNNFFFASQLILESSFLDLQSLHINTQEEVVNEKILKFTGSLKPFPLYPLTQIINFHGEIDAKNRIIDLKTLDKSIIVHGPINKLQINLNDIDLKTMMAIDLPISNTSASLIVSPEKCSWLNGSIRLGKSSFQISPLEVTKNQIAVIETSDITINVSLAKSNNLKFKIKSNHEKPLQETVANILYGKEYNILSEQEKNETEQICNKL